jgi:4-hydroxybenzoate polyprenyltransferase
MELDDLPGDEPSQRSSRAVSEALEVPPLVPGKLPPLLALLRPQQWLKNLFCLTPVIFAGRAGDAESLMRAGVCTLGFCAASSAVYALNDILDRERDAQHPMKRSRPVASGALDPRTAGGMACAAFAMAMLLSGALGVRVLALVLSYVAINVLYSCWFKRIVIFDVLLISSGFLLRIFAGAEAVQVPVSTWILLCTFFLALFLGFSKRRAELAHSGAAAGQTRAVLVEYDAATLDTLTSICATLAIACYALFTTSPGRQSSLIITIPPVAFAIFRYLVVCRRGAGESTDAVLTRDQPILIAIAVWLGLYVWVLYGGLRLNLQ